MEISAVLFAISAVSCKYLFIGAECDNSTTRLFLVQAEYLVILRVFSKLYSIPIVVF